MIQIKNKKYSNAERQEFLLSGYPVPSHTDILGNPIYSWVEAVDDIGLDRTQLARMARLLHVIPRANNKGARIYISTEQLDQLRYMKFLISTVGFTWNGAIQQIEIFGWENSREIAKMKIFYKQRQTELKQQRNGQKIQNSPVGAADGGYFVVGHQGNLSVRQRCDLNKAQGLEQKRQWRSTADRGHEISSLVQQEPDGDLRDISRRDRV